MKRTLLVFLVLITAFTAAAGDEKFVQAMRTQIDRLYKAGSLEEYQTVVNTIDRIAEVEKDRWEPLYYSAFGKVMMALRESAPEKKDAHLDGALDAVTRAQALAPNESELYAMEGFVHMIRVTVNPGERGPVFAMKANTAYGRALALRPENPRAMVLQAQMDFGTATFFHASTAEACKTNEAALVLLEKPTEMGPLHPTWGKSVALDLKSQCEKSSKN